MTSATLTTDQCAAIGRIDGKDFARQRIRDHHDPEMRALIAMTPEARTAYCQPAAGKARTQAANVESERQRMVLVSDKLLDLAGRGADGEGLEAYVAGFEDAFCAHFDAYTAAIATAFEPPEEPKPNRAAKRKAAALAKKAKAP